MACLVFFLLFFFCLFTYARRNYYFFAWTYRKVLHASTEKSATRSVLRRLDEFKKFFFYLADVSEDLSSFYRAVWLTFFHMQGLFWNHNWHTRPCFPRAIHWELGSTNWRVNFSAVDEKGFGLCVAYCFMEEGGKIRLTYSFWEMRT